MSSEEGKIDPGSPQGEGFEELFEGFAAATPGGSKIEGAGGSDGDGAGSRRRADARGVIKAMQNEGAAQVHPRTRVDELPSAAL